MKKTITRLKENIKIMKSDDKVSKNNIIKISKKCIKLKKKINIKIMKSDDKVSKNNIIKISKKCIKLKKKITCIKC